MPTLVNSWTSADDVTPAAWDDYRRTILWSLVYPVGAITEDLTDPRALDLLRAGAIRNMLAIADLDATDMFIR